MIDPTDLLGRWHIVSWEQLYADGRVQQPMGEHLDGVIDYSAEGNMTCLISRRERANFVNGGQWNAPDEDKAAAYNSMLAYGGRYRLEQADGKTVIVHMVDYSLFPNWKGGEQRREVELRADGSIALLARLEQGTSEARVAQLVWRRQPSNIVKESV